MSIRKKKKKTRVTTIMNEDRNSRERGRVRNINTEYDRLVVQLGGVVVEPGKDRKRAVAPTEKPNKSKLRKEDILFEAANYMRALMAELEEVKALMAKDVEVSAAANYIKICLGNFCMRVAKKMIALLLLSAFFMESLLARARSSCK